jgi:hypothetical protein
VDIENLIATTQELQVSQQMIMTDTKATRASQVEVKATMRAGQEKMEANEEGLETKMGVKMDTTIYAIEEWLKVMIKAGQEEMKVIIQSIWPELQETINSWVESILASVNQ